MNCIISPFMWNHWVVRACTPQKPFQDFETARWLWSKLGDVFPEMVSAVLMPNHLHLILPQSKPTKEAPHHELRKLGGLLSAISKRKGLRKLWQPIPSPATIPDRHHLLRQIRYVALNPCRKRLCADPLEWYWSTYRDVMGASAEMQERMVHLAKTLGETETNFRVRFHNYVSADPSVKVEGTPLPVPAIPKVWAEESIGEILSAAASALRALPMEVQQQGALRVLFIHLASRHGWHQPLLLSKICGSSSKKGAASVCRRHF